MASTIWNATKATAINAIKDYVTTNLIGTNADGAPYFKREEARAWLIGEYGLVFTDAKVGWTNNLHLFEQNFGSPPNELEAILDRLELAYSPESFAKHSSWPLTNASQSKDELVAQISRLQVQAQKAAEAIVIHYEDQVAKIRPAVEQWFSANVLNKTAGDPGAFPDGVDRVTQTFVYAITWVTDWGEESAPSAMTNLVDVDQNDRVLISRPSVPSGYNITHWRIYRSAAGTDIDRTTLAFRVELPVATASYTDELDGVVIGKAVATRGWIPPPATLKGMRRLPNGSLAGFVDDTLYFSETNAPYAWPVRYALPIGRPIVGIEVVGQTVYVLTHGAPSLVSGADAASMSELTLDWPQACASKRSIAPVSGGVVYASPDGLCLLGDGVRKVLTEGRYGRAEWQALGPTTMFGVEHEGVYFCWHSSGCLMIDLASGEIGTIDLPASAAWVDRLTDALYVVNGTQISRVFGGALKRTGVWASKTQRLARHASFAWLKVVGQFTAPVTVRVFVDGGLSPWVTMSVASDTPVRLPAGRFVDYKVEVESQSRVAWAVLTSDTAGLQAEVA